MKLPVYLYAHQLTLEKESALKRKNLLPLGSKSLLTKLSHLKIFQFPLIKWVLCHSLLLLQLHVIYRNWFLKWFIFIQYLDNSKLGLQQQDLIAVWNKVIDLLKQASEIDILTPDLFCNMNLHPWFKRYFYIVQMNNIRFLIVFVILPLS